MKIISYYVGSQARWLVKTFPTDIKKIPYITFVKIRAWLLRPLIQEYWVDGEYLVGFIKEFKRGAKTRVVTDKVKYTKSIEKVKHDRFTVMYYYPKKRYNKKYVYWVYGQDIIQKLIDTYPDFNWVCVDGSADMGKIVPFVDVYIRPNRHDGSPRLIMECETWGIPYYHSTHNPDMGELSRFLVTEFEKFKNNQT